MNLRDNLIYGSKSTVPEDKRRLEIYYTKPNIIKLCVESLDIGYREAPIVIKD
jgi:hypothetical protein